MISSAAKQAFRLELKQAQLARRQQLWPQAWFHAERAHILGQQHLLSHFQSHWLMLKLAADQADWAEIRGQVLRLLLTPVGHFTGRLPLGNPGSSRFPVLQPLPVPEDLQDLLSGTKDPLL